MAKLTKKELDREVMKVLDEIEGTGGNKSKPNILERLRAKAFTKGGRTIESERR